MEEGEGPPPAPPFSPPPPALVSADVPSAWWHVVRSGRADYLASLLESFPNSTCLECPEPTGGQTPLLLACQSGDPSCVRLLLDAKANVNARDKNGLTGLMVVATHHQSEWGDVLPEAHRDLVMKLLRPLSTLSRVVMEYLLNGDQTTLCAILIRAKADVNALDRSNASAVHHAVKPSWNSTSTGQVLQTLLSARANPNLGQSALSRALFFSADHAAELLLAFKANVDVGSSSLIQAVNRGSFELVALLIDARANINARVPLTHEMGQEMDDGFTPLMFAAQRGRDDLVNYLLENGADANAECFSWRQLNALALAKEGGHTDCIKLLQVKTRASRR